MFHIQKKFLLQTLRVELSKLFVVAGHAKVNAEELTAPYLEVYRSDSEEFTNRVTEIEGIKSPTITWSEYAQFFYSFPLKKDIKTFGFMQYRSMLDLSGTRANLSYLPFNSRKSFCDIQLGLVDGYKEKIVVGEKLDFPCSAWKQFTDCHPNSEDMLRIACKEFDSMFDKLKIDSEKILRSNDYIYSRNMFIAPVWFANSWNEIALNMVKYLDDNAQDGCEERWGGFILERLFSVYVYIHACLNPNLVVEKPVIFFEER